MKSDILNLTGEMRELLIEHFERQRHVVTPKDGSAPRLEGKQIKFETPIGKQKSLTEGPSLGVRFIQLIQDESNRLANVKRTPEEQNRLDDLKLILNSSRHLIDREKMTDEIREQVVLADMKRLQAWLPDLVRVDPHADSEIRIIPRMEIFYPRGSKQRIAAEPVEAVQSTNGKASDNDSQSLEASAPILEVEAIPSEEDFATLSEMDQIAEDAARGIAEYGEASYDEGVARLRARLDSIDSPALRKLVEESILPQEIESLRDALLQKTQKGIQRVAKIPAGSATEAPLAEEVIDIPFKSVSRSKRRGRGLDKKLKTNPSKK